MRWMKQLLRRLSEDRGATAVIVAVSLTALMGWPPSPSTSEPSTANGASCRAAPTPALWPLPRTAVSRAVQTGTANATADSYATSNANDG